MEGSPGLTDPAHEVAALGELLLSLAPDRRITFDVLAGVMGIASNDSDFVFAMAVVNRRFDDISEYVRGLDDSVLGLRGRNEIRESLQRLRSVFYLSSLATQWESVLRGNVKEHDIGLMEMLSVHMRRTQPLRKLSNEERGELLVAISGAIDDVCSQEALPEWMRAPLVDGLRQLQLTVKHIVFFGHSQAIDSLFHLRRTVEGVRAAQPLDNDVAMVEGKQRSLRKVVEVLILGGALFSLPDQAITAFDRYKGWMVHQISHSDSATAPTLFLPPPDGGEPADTP